MNYIDIRACILVWFKWLECTTTVPPVGPFVEYYVHIYDDNWLSIYSHYVMAQAVRMSVRSSVITSFRPSVSKWLWTQHLTTVFSGCIWNLLGLSTMVRSCAWRLDFYSFFPNRVMTLSQICAYAYIANCCVPTVFSGWSWNHLAMHLFQVFAYAYIANSVVL